MKATTKRNGKRTRLEKREIEKEFWFELTPKEKDQFGKTAGNINGDITQDEMRFTDIKKEWTAKIKLKKQDLTDTLETLRLGKEHRKVKCTEIKDFTKGTVSWIFNKKTIRSVKMQASDMQTSMALPENTNKKASVKNTTKAKTKNPKAKAPVRRPNNPKSRSYASA